MQRVDVRQGEMIFVDVTIENNDYEDKKFKVEILPEDCFLVPNSNFL